MTNSDMSFRDWSDLVQMNLQEHGVDYDDVESLSGDYHAGRDVMEVVSEILQEYE